jgi:hypothetical protein
MILLDFIEANTDPNDPAQVHARAWAQRVRELQARGDELLMKAKAQFDADDFDAMDKTLEEHDAVLAEVVSLCHRQVEVTSRMRTSTETMQ